MNMGNESRIEKSYFDVLGLCCSSEIPLIEKILNPLDGIQKISVIVASKTVIVLHDPNKISQLQIVKELNKARLEASIRSYGRDKMVNKWPSPYILACGILLLISLLQRFYRPLKWLALSAVVIGLPQILLRSLAAIRRYTLDINILMLIAVGGAVALRDYSEAGFIVFLFTMAEWLESIAGQKATTGMTMLMNLAPQKAVLAETGQYVDVKDVKVGTILAVKAGEVIPIDGIVVEGRSEVDEKSLTGESFPVTKQPESLVWAGTLNIDGYISVKTTALSEHSAVSKMARLVEEAQNSRSKTQRMIDSCAKYYTPAVVIIAAGVALFPIVSRAHNQKKHWFQLALVLLVSACPCALVLSTPVATFCALLKAARTGLLVKGGDVLEELARTKVMAFDKTGTITTGEFSVVQLRSLSSEVTMDMLLSWISSLESKSSHPMASALVDYARIRSIESKAENVNDFQIYPGEGVSGEINGKKIYIGNKRIAMRAGCARAPDAEDMKEAVTVGYVFLGVMPIGIFRLSDACRTGAKEAIEELKSLGIKTAMLTGDSTAAAMQAQKQLGNIIEEIHAELLPEDKVKIISDLKSKKGSITMVGDGMNDAPALAMANVGISMGVSGSAVAVETSHVTLMSNDILKIPKAIRLAKKTKQKIIVNIIFSLVTKIGILGLAIGGHPLLWAAVLADVGTCLIVILNSMTLLPTNKKKVKKSCQGSHHQRTCSDKCSNGSCGPKSIGCHGSHGCNKNKGAEEKKPCCKSKELQAESAARCCQGNVICRKNGRDEHLVAMNCEEDSHKEDGSCGNHSNSAINHTIPYHKCKGAEEKKPYCKSKERQPESAAQCCLEKAICRENGRDEHLIVMNYEEDSHKEDESCGNHSSREIKHTVPCHKSQGAEEKKSCCKSKERQAESAAQCCQGKVICRENGRDELLIVMNCKEDSLRKDDSCGNHSSRAIEHTVPCHELHFKKSKADNEHLISPCSHEEQREHGSCEGHSNRQTNHGVHSHHESARNEKKSIHRLSEQKINCNLKLNKTKNCCNTCADQTMGAKANLKASTEPNGPEKKNTDNCYEGEKDECHRRHECSNLPASKRKEIGGCCRSYRKECSRRETCCGNGMIQVPEIIIE